MGNYVKGYRFTDGYEDVIRHTDTLYTYVQAEPYMDMHNLCAIDYESNGDGTYSMRGDWYGVSVDYAASTIEESPAPIDIAAKIVGAEFMRAYACDSQQYDEDEPLDVMGLIDVASCHLLGSGNYHNAFEPNLGDTYGDFLTRWENALEKSGVQLDG